MPVIPALKRLRQKDLESKGSLGYPGYRGGGGKSFLNS
jgi:hypothetical protein